MSSKLLIALLAVIVVAAGAGAYIAFAGDDTDDGKDADDSGPGTDDPSDPGSDAPGGPGTDEPGTDDPSQPGTDDPGADTPDVPGPSSFEFLETVETGDWISQTISGTWKGEPVRMDVVYLVKYSHGYDLIYDIIAEKDGSFEILEMMNDIFTQEFELLPIGMLDEIPYYLGPIDIPESTTTGSLFDDPVGRDTVGTPRGNIECDRYHLEANAVGDGIDVIVDVWYYPGTHLPCRMVADYGGDILTFVSDSNLLMDGSGNGPGSEPGLPPAPAPDTEYTIQYLDESNVYGLALTDGIPGVGTIGFSYEFGDSGYGSGGTEMNWEWGTTDFDPSVTPFVEFPWYYTLGEKPDVSNAASLGKELVGTYIGDLLCNHYSMTYDGKEMEWWNYSGTDFIAVFEMTDENGTVTFYYYTDRLVKSTDGPGTDTPDEPSGGDRTFMLGEPQVGDWISGIMTEEYEGVTTESTIMFEVTAVEGDTMTVEIAITEKGTVLESDIAEGIPTSIFGILGLAYIVGVGDGGDSSFEPVLVGSEITSTSRGNVQCDRYNIVDMVDYWIIGETEFLAKIMVSNDSGVGTILFDSNRLVETS